MQAALHADRAAHSQAAQAMSAASADTHAMKRAEAKIHAVEEKIHAAMDERLALLERCFADQIENLRKAVETGDAEREVLRGRVEILEATLATKEDRREVVYSCPPLDPGERLGHPSSPPAAPRGTRPPPVVIDVEDVPCPPFQGSAVTHQPLHAPEGVQGARDDDVDEMREDEDTETLTETTEEAGAEESFYLSADDDAEEFEVTLAGFRSEPAKVVTAQPAALAKNPFQGLMDKDGDEADEAEDEDEEDVAKVVVKRREGTSPTSPLSPPKHRGSASSSSRETSLDEDTVEEALAAIAREEDEARKRRTKKSRKKGSGGKKSAAEKREAKVAAYLQKKVEAKHEINPAEATEQTKKKNRGVSWADEAPVTVPTTAVTGERIRMLHSARIHMTEAQRTRLAAVFGPDAAA